MLDNIVVYLILNILFQECDEYKGGEYHFMSIEYENARIKWECKEFGTYHSEVDFRWSWSPSYERGLGFFKDWHSEYALLQFFIWTLSNDIVVWYKNIV